ncbi:hypothetical protein B0A50_06236 [Salinomyces thailandicus]|uniref:Uncharacterized protein n=1 Tax=Salinomyces thailandicus TaxID=706561 RepID=A0A4U0TTP7_9PEZI|nr:hypothetical protein B0A50_06236 [Salinomyces thailandica]
MAAPVEAIESRSARSWSEPAPIYKMSKLATSLPQISTGPKYKKSGMTDCLEAPPVTKLSVIDEEITTEEQDNSTHQSRGRSSYQRLPTVEDIQAKQHKRFRHLLGEDGTKPSHHTSLTPQTPPATGDLNHRSHLTNDNKVLYGKDICIILDKHRQRSPERRLNSARQDFDYWSAVPEEGSHSTRHRDGPR